MNPFLCFVHEEMVKAKNGSLIPEWRTAHKGLGGKWRALGAARANFKRHGRTPAFAMFIKASEKRKAILPSWIQAHKGLGAKWKRLDNASKARYVAASRQMRNAYEQRMKAYRQAKMGLIKRERETKSKAKHAMKAKKMEIRRVKLEKKKSAKRNKKMSSKKKGKSIGLLKKSKKSKLVKKHKKAKKPKKGKKAAKRC